MADVHVMPGVERRDLMGEPVPSERVLTSATEKGVTDVVIIGRQRDGSLYMAAEDNNADAVVGKLMRGVDFLVRAVVSQE